MFRDYWGVKRKFCKKINFCDVFVIEGDACGKFFLRKVF